MRGEDIVYCWSSLLIFWLQFVWLRRYALPYYDPRCLVTLSWLVSFTLLCLNFVTYEVVLTWQAFAFLHAFNFTFMIGANLVRVDYRRVATPLFTQEYSILHPKTFLALTLLSGLYALTSAPDVIGGITQLGNIGLGNLRSEYLQELRDAEGTSLVRIVISFLKSVAFIQALYLPFAYHYKERGRVIICAGVFFYLVLTTFAVGGRSLLSYIVFIYFVCFFILSNSKKSLEEIRRNKGKLMRLCAFTVLGVLFVWVIFGKFMSARNQYLEGRYNLYLGFQQHAYISPWFEKVTFNNHELASVAYGMTYLTSSVPGFTLLIGDQSISEAYLLGTQSSDFLSKIVAAVTGTNYATVGRETIATVLASDGLWALNPWATFLRDAVMDFGEVGGIIFGAFCGWLIMFLYKIGFFARSFTTVALMLLAMLIAYIIPLRGPFNLTVISNSLVLLLVYQFFVRLRPEV